MNDGHPQGWRRLIPAKVRDAQPGSVALYLVLLGVAVGTVVLYFALPDHPIIHDFAPEVATSALAILVTLAFVQRLLDRQEWRRRLRGSMGGLRQAARVLDRFQGAWAAVLKGCLRAIPVNHGSTLGLFTDVRTEELMYLDPGAVASSGGQPVLAWMADEIDVVRDALRVIARQYASGFDVEYLEAIEELVDDPFLDMVAKLGRAPIAAHEWRVRINTARGARARSFSQLVRVIELHNTLAAEAGQLRGSRPRTHELGIVLAADHDLKVETALSDAWWNKSPEPGALREGMA